MSNPRIRAEILADPEVMAAVTAGWTPGQLAEKWGNLYTRASWQRLIDDWRAGALEGFPPPGAAPSSGQEVDVERTVFLNDLHIPHQDPHVVRVVLDFIEWWRPEFIFLNGDIADMYQISSFDRNPLRVLQLQDDLDQMDAFLADLRKRAPTADITWTEGNHEYRLTRYLWRHPEISNLRGFKSSEFYGADKHNIRWVSQSETYLHHGFVVTHGTIVRKDAGMSAKAEFEKHGTNGISGHTHRCGLFRRSNFSGDYIWIENGCLADLNPEYVQNPNWQHCISVGEFIKGESRFQVEPIQIHKGKLLWQGRLFD